MNFKLSEDHRAIQRIAEEFSKKEIAPIVEADEKSHRFQKESVKKINIKT